MHNRAVHRLVSRRPARRPHALYDEAAERFAALGEDYPGLVRDRCEALLAAGLVPEAIDLVTAGASRWAHCRAGRARELLLVLASAELTDDPAARGRQRISGLATCSADSGATAGPCGRSCVVLLARHRAGRRGRRLVDSATSMAGRLVDATPEDAAVAWLLAGRAGARRRTSDAATALLDRGRDLPDRTPPAWSARPGGRREPCRCESEADRRGVLAACRRGLDALDEHRASLGQLRAAGPGQPPRRRARVPRPAPRGARADLARCWSGASVGAPTRCPSQPVRPPDDAGSGP